MKFYERIVAYYDEIFPYNPKHKSFINATCPSTEYISVLDVGCGTGSLCIELAKDYVKVTGIDPDKMMLRVAQGKASNAISNLQFFPFGMLNLKNQFEPCQFDVLLCFGNTLAHLDSAEEIVDFFRQAKTVLNPGGKLLLQIINYDRIIEKQIKALPTIENEQLIFKRDYLYESIKNKIHFNTSLYLKGEKKEIKNHILLYPVRKNELSNILLRAGFKTFTFYGNFDRDALSNESIPLLVEAM